MLDDFVFRSLQVVFLCLQRVKKKKVQVHSYSWKPAGRESVLAVVCFFSVFCFFFFVEAALQILLSIAWLHVVQGYVYSADRLCMDQCSRYCDSATSDPELHRCCSETNQK